MARHAWKKITMEYVTTDISYRKLAEKHAVPFSTLKDRAAKYKWTELRKKHRADLRRKTTHKTAEMVAEMIKKQVAVSESLTEAIIKALRDPDQFSRYVVAETHGDTTYYLEKLFDKTDTKAIKDLVQSLAALESVNRNIYGLLTEPDRQKLELMKQRLKLEERKLALDERKNGLGAADDGEAGVVQLPAVGPEQEGIVVESVDANQGDGVRDDAAELAEYVEIPPGADGAGGGV